MLAGLQLAVENNVERAHWLGVFAGSVFLFVVSLFLVALAAQIRRTLPFKVIPGLVGVIGFAVAYLLYGQIASAVEETLLLRFVETGFICILPGVFARWIIPLFVVAAALMARRIWLQRRNAV